MKDSTQLKHYGLDENQNSLHYSVVTEWHLHKRWQVMQAHVDHTTPFLPDPPVLGPKLPPFKIGLHMMADLSMLLLIWTISSHEISCPPQ